MRILDVTLQAVDVERLRRYYAGVLGLREITTTETDGFTVQAGSTRLTFTPAGTNLAGGQPRYHFAFDVPPARFDAARQWLHQRGEPIASAAGETQFHGSWNADSVYFADPQGNILELIARHTAPAAPGRQNPGADQPFNAAEIIAVSELGLAADSVTGAVSMLLSHMPGLSIYDGEGSDTFTAVGDPYGLLIVVRRGRIWFPDTGVPAQPLPLHALVEVDPGRRYRVSAPPFPCEVVRTG